MQPEISKDTIRGHTTTIVLNILNQGDSYGYAVAKTIKQMSQAAYDINEATLYTVFRRLEKTATLRVIGVMRLRAVAVSIIKLPPKDERPWNGILLNGTLPNK